MASNSFTKKRARPSPDRKPPTASKKGATGRERRITDLVRGYFRHHRQVFKSSLARLLLDPVQTLMTSLVVAIALGLPAALYVALENLQHVGNSVRETGQLSVFIKHGAKSTAIEQLQQDLAKQPGVEAVEYISPEQALDEFQAVSGFGEVLTLLDENPLPAVVLVRYDEALELQQLDAMTSRFKQQPLIDDVRVDMEWVQRLQGILEIARKLALSLGMVLSLGVLLIVGNTIRLEIENRRDEIIVVKLVGGTDSYVRRPFLYTGLWYGLFGGIFAWLFVTLGVFWLGDTVERLASLYQSSFRLQGLGGLGLLSLAAISALLGLLGAIIAVSKHIAALEPR